jgi:hypothetical protein
VTILDSDDSMAFSIKGAILMNHQQNVQTPIVEQKSHFCNLPISKQTAALRAMPEAESPSVEMTSVLPSMNVSWSGSSCEGMANLSFHTTRNLFRQYMNPYIAVMALSAARCVSNNRCAQNLLSREIIIIVLILPSLAKCSRISGGLRLPSNQPMKIDRSV